MMRLRLKLTILFLALGLFWAAGAVAEVPGSMTPPTPQFAFTGFIQEAMLDTAGVICTPPNDPATGLPSDRLRGGVVTVNGIRLIVPCNSIIQLPAATMTWGDLFDPAQSAPVGSYIGAPAVPVPASPVVGGTVKTGLALADNPMPFPSFEVSAVGNVVGKYPADIDVNGDGVADLLTGTDRYVIALIVPIEQQVLNGSSGIVSYIDYTIGAFRVGGIPNDAACDANGITSPLCSGALAQFNDPVGRWGLVHSPDPRFSGDYENTTVHISTGFPLCIPRVAPPAIDPECPLGNRPLNGDLRFPIDPFLEAGAPLKIFQMPPPPGQPGADPSGFPDATRQVPMMVGDQVFYIGTLYKIDPARTITLPDGSVVPDNTAANTYMSVHTVEDSMEITTTPGVPPAYVFIEGFLIGAGGAPLPGLLQEATTRLFVVGFTTDPTRLVDIYAQDINPCSGEASLRLLATTDPATQPLKTRFVHHVLGGNFGVPTRNYTIKSRTQLLDPLTGQRVEQIVANGIVAGEFSLPLFEFIVPENHRLGDPIIPGNYQDFPFLAQGSGPVDGFLSGSAIVGQLDPWPGLPAPTTPVCAGGGVGPIVFAGADFTVASGALVTLPGSITVDPDSVVTSILWKQTGGPLVALSDATTLTPTFTAPFLSPGQPPVQLIFTLTATDQFGTGTDSMIVTVNSQPDTVVITNAIWVIQRGRRGGFGKLDVRATTDNPALTLTVEMVSAVDGSILRLGAMTPILPPGTFNFRELKGALEPSSVTVRSSGGGSATVDCAPLPNRPDRVLCQ